MKHEDKLDENGPFVPYVPQGHHRFLPRRLPLNHDATNLIHHLVALTVSDPCQTKIHKGNH